MAEKTRNRIIMLLEKERSKLNELLKELPVDEFEKPGVVGDWSVKDVLAHLAHWEEGMLTWLKIARDGIDVTGPEEGLKWKDMKEFNRRIYEAHKNEPLEEVMQYFHLNHEKFLNMVKQISDDELLTNGYYAFTEKKAVYDWLNQYAGHDHWGREKIKIWMQKG